MRITARLALLAVLLFATAPLFAQRGPAKADLTPLVETDTVTPGSDVRLALTVQLPEGYHMNSNKPRDPLLIPVVLTIPAPDQALPAGVTVSEIVFPAATDLDQRGTVLSVFEREFTIGVTLKVAAGTAAGKVSIPARLRYQACDESMCYIPTRAETSWDFTVGAARSAAAHGDVFGRIAFGHGEAPAAADAAATAAAAPVATPAAGAPTGTVDPTGAAEVAALDKFEEQGTTFGYLPSGDFLTFIHNAENGVREKGMLEGRGPLAILLVVLIGGLALNLTPCVLPMIPINLAIIGAGAQAGSRKRGFLLGLTYGGAMAFVYGVLGLIVILTASTFGTINASPWFNLGIAVLFVALALAMFDVFEIDFSRFAGTVGGGAGRGTFTLAFTMGAVAALLAGACVAPVVIQVVLFASNLYATGTSAALALPFFLGIGMAIPWPIAGAGLASLPKPGPWMVRVKQAFGVLILGTAVYYGYLSYELFANQFVDPKDVSASVEEQLKAGWTSSLADGLARAEKEGKPVLIDMWATWCKNCLTMDKTTLSNATVTAALDGYVKIKVQAEQPDEAPAVDLMKRFKAVGLPAYAIIRPPSAKTRGN